MVSSLKIKGRVRNLRILILKRKRKFKENQVRKSHIQDIVIIFKTNDIEHF
jgi:hypothetical protein